MNRCGRLTSRHSGAVIAEQVAIADGFWSRLLGWQFRSAPPAGHGLLLVPCASVHTFGLRFPIDAVALDRTGRVLAVHRAVPPGSILP
ncbi:MAG: DUF192 domain-containing protein, partial [Gemmataceae bacterium]|nr:DUF192 domain-containing protein [Gemmataceae bacterium]MDW8264067.1 DUF192 domain-containing protein [Gemmataceae bacterium]